MASLSLPLPSFTTPSPDSNHDSGLEVKEGVIEHPPMGSSLILELWQDEKSAEYFVRAIYNQEQTVPAIGECVCERSFVS